MPIIHTWNKRRLGLSKTQKPPSLLTVIRNRDIHVKGENKARISEMGQAAMIKEPDSITAPPQSSDYEDYKQENSDDDSQDSHGNDRKNQRGDIRPTIFSTLPSSQTSNVGRNTRGRSAPSSQAQRLASDSQNDEPTSSAGSKRSAENPVPETGNHLKNTYGFTKKSKTTVGGYSGSKSSQPRSQPRSSQIKSSQKSAPRSSARQRGG